MLAYIKTNYKTGDSIEVTTTQGVIVGSIEYVAEQYIILRQPNGQICGISASDIHSFRADCPIPFKPQEIPTTKISEETSPTANENEEICNDEKPADTFKQPTQQEEKDILSAAIVEPKVVGHIDLDKLRQIDPKFSRRNYFRNTEGNNMTTDSQNEKEMVGTRENTYSTSTNNYHQHYVGAKGRITYYNNEKRYGFIHDYNTDSDLYFHYQQVADYELYDHLYKGTKVTYSMENNSQGLTARCVHLPHTVSELLTMAEEYYDSHYYQFVQGIAEHILEVEEDNKEAKDLLSELHNITSTPRFTPTAFHTLTTQYNPCTIYSAAKKAYLAKDNALAEELYQKAIEAGEKPESCVKDLVTLYVSNFKQTVGEEEKEKARQKAIDFLNSHRQLLSDNLTTKQFLALNFYLPILDYEKFIATVDEILADPQVNRVLSRRVFYIWQKSIALNKMGHSEEALHLVEQGLSIAPRSRQLLNLRNMILYPEIAEKPTVTFSAEELVASKEAKEENEEKALNTLNIQEDVESNNNQADKDFEQLEEEKAVDDSVKEESSHLHTEEQKGTDDAMGEVKDDAWWDELKKPME